MLQAVERVVMKREDNSQSKLRKPEWRISGTEQSLGSAWANVSVTS